MRKYFITLMLALVCVFALVVSVSAEEYEVSSDYEYQAAYEKAVNGDTIIIGGKLTCDIQATKDITYILKADWESPKLLIASNTEVSFVSDGGNYRIMPTGYSTTSGWLNITTTVENVTINLMGINGGTVTFDGTNATHDRVSYVEKASDITWNLFDGAAIANFSPTTKDFNNYVSIIYAKTFNMYDGSKIYANKIVCAPLIKTTEFFIHGGEIVGNLITSTKTSADSCGAIYVSNLFVMWDGTIHSNIFSAKAGNFVGFFTVKQEKSTVLLGGELGVNYTSGTGGTDISAMFGSTASGIKAYGYYTSNFTFGTRKVFTAGTPELIHNEDFGETVWQIINPTFGAVSENWQGFSWVHYKGVCDNVASFFKIKDKQIKDNIFYELELRDLFVVGVTTANGSNVVAQRNYTYSYSGAASLTIPSEVSAWSTQINEYCHNGKAITIDEIGEAMPVVLYASFENPLTDETGTTSCSICGKMFVCENQVHEKNITIIYDDYTKFGIKTIRCRECNTVCTMESPALFTCLGYSAPENGRGGIAIGYIVNNEAIKEYENATGKTIKYGVFAVAKEKLGNNDIFGSDGSVADNVINAEISNYEFVSFELKIIGFTDEYKDAKLALGAYVAVTEGETTEYSYMQSGTPNEGEKYCFVSYNDIVGEPSSEEEVAQ